MKTWDEVYAIPEGLSEELSQRVETQLRNAYETGFVASAMGKQLEDDMQDKVVAYAKKVILYLVAKELGQL